MKILSSILILALYLFSGCQQQTGTDDKVSAIQQVPDPIPVPRPPAPLPHPEPPPPIVKTLPEVSFAFDEWRYDGTGQVLLQLNLTKPSEVPVSVDIILNDGTAFYPKDYIGFDGSSANDLKITVDIPANTTNFQVPALIIPDGGNCDVVFSARLNKDTAQYAIVAKELTTIQIPCM